MMMKIAKDIILVWLALLFTVMLLSGCSLFTNNEVIQTNNFRQTNYYTEECYTGKKTFSEIIICVESKSQMEIAQNNATNEMLDEK